MDHESTTGADDATLAQAWAAGDEGGYTALVNRYAPMVYSRCRRALGVADADDATQAVFLVLARKRQQAAASPALAAWLLTVADFVIRNARRDRGRLRQIAAPELLNDMPAPEPPMTDIREHLDACMERLPAAEREAVRLHHLAGHTLAEVAAHTGVPLSTVHDRVRRGLERMKPLLVRRGVHAASITVILACLQAEAAAATMPSGLMAHLRDLAPAGGGTGATAAPSDRALRWSRPRMSPMTRIALAGAAVLLLGSATAPFLLTASETPATPPRPVQPVAVAPPPAPAAVPEFDLDPERARGWLTLRWLDGARTAERLRRLPELALLAEASPGVLEQIAGLSEAAVVLRPDDILPREQRVRQYALQRDLLRLSTEQQVQRVIATFDEQVRLAEDQAAGGAAPPSRLSVLAGCEGWFEFSSAEAQLPVAGMIDDGVFGLFKVGGTADGWTLGDERTVRVVRDGRRLNLHGSLTPMTPDPLAGPRPVSAADIELVNWLDPGLPGAVPVRANIMSLTVTADGLRLASTGAWQTTQQRQAAESWPRLDLARLDAVPANAFLACAVPLQAEKTATSVFIQAMLRATERQFATPPTGTQPQSERARVMVAALSEAIRSIDGAIVAWIEPGVPVPTITVEADLPRAAAEALIAATGEPRAADGSITTFTGMVSLTLGWQDGRLILTSVPGGLAAIDRRGGFTRHQDVQRAFAAMPSKQTNLCTVLRPTALVECIAPFVAMAGPEWSKRLADYEQRLEQESAYAYLTIRGDAQGMHIDAAGLLSLVAGGVLAASAQSPMRIAN